MFSFRKNKEKSNSAPDNAEKIEPKKSWASRLKSGLSKTRSRFSERVSSLILGKKEINQELLDDIEASLISADMGIDTAEFVIKELTSAVARKQLSDPAALMEALQTILQNILEPLSVPIELAPAPHIFLMVGVNGAGKTTSIAKIAHYFKQQNKSVMLAAGDTFRAAAVEQLKVWGERNNVTTIAQHTGADSASVIFDAMQAATARGVDVLIADTAGRLHTQNHLMEELKKIKRVMSKITPEAPNDVMLIIDASLGQNSLNQAREFHEAIGLNSLCITKLDGTAKGGIIFSIARELGLPIRFIGVGEGIDDLQPFDAGSFVRALWDVPTTVTDAE
jgi:fused signal recognition particle receptor